MKTIIITGAAGNLGSTVTKTFLHYGYRIIATVISEAEKSTMPVNTQLDVRIVNLTNSEETKEFANQVIAQYQKVDGVLMLVGGFAAGNIETTSLSDITKMITLNFETAFNIAQPMFKHFRDNNYGRLVFIGARPAMEASAGKSMIAYGLSKSMLLKFSEYLNAEAGKLNIVSTVVVPSTLDTAANRASMPEANPNDWVDITKLSEILEFIFSAKADQLREPVLKVYNNA